MIIATLPFLFNPTHDVFTRFLRPCGEILALVECSEAAMQLLLQTSIVARLGYFSKCITALSLLDPKINPFFFQPNHNYYLCA